MFSIWTVEQNNVSYEAGNQQFKMNWELARRTIGNMHPMKI